MIKKYLPYILIVVSLVLLLILMTTIQNLRNNGEGIMHLETIMEAVFSILFMTVGIAMILKRV